jgi:hypothetical protein
VIRAGLVFRQAVHAEVRQHLLHRRRAIDQPSAVGARYEFADRLARIGRQVADDGGQ